MTTNITYLAGEFDTLEQLINSLKLSVDFSSILFSAAVWAIIGFVIAGQAKKYGMNSALHFCLCFFFRIFGTIASVIIIDKRKKELYNSNRGYPNQFYDQTQNYGQPYNQMYGNSGYGQGYQQQRIEQPNYGQQMYGQTPQYDYSTQYNQNAQYVYNQQYGQNPQYGAQYGQPYQYAQQGYPFDRGNSGGNMTFTCPHCGFIQDTGGRCLNCSEKVTNYYPFS